MNGETPEARALRRFLAAAMMAVGGLIAALCGTCTVIAAIGVVATVLQDALRGHVESLGLLAVLLVGIIPTIVGVVVFRAGRASWRRHPARPPSVDAFD